MGMSPEATFGEEDRSTVVSPEPGASKGPYLVLLTQGKEVRTI